MRQSAKKDVSADIAAIFNNAQEYPVFTSIDDQATLVYNNTVDFYKWYIQPKTCLLTDRVLYSEIISG